MEAAPAITYVGRFAPSPSGPLHFGSLVAAVASYVDARAHGGRWLVRIEDVDRSRTSEAAETDILQTLAAFGLKSDVPVVRQRDRDAAYAAALKALHTAGTAFPCACTRREWRGTARRGPAGLIYPGTCRRGLPAGRHARAWRYLSRGQHIAFDDLSRGRQRVDLEAAIGDFVIRRGDGLFAYHLAVVLDDAAAGVTHVVRGGDLLACTAPQIALQHSLGLATPAYLHLPVAVDAAGRKLSKQTGAPALDTARSTALLAAALGFLGHPPPADSARPLDWAIAHWRRDHLPVVVNRP